MFTKLNIDLKWSDDNCEYWIDGLYINCRFVNIQKQDLDTLIARKANRVRLLIEYI